MSRGAGYRGNRPARSAALLRGLLCAALVALALPGRATAGTEDLALCLEGRATLAAYADAFAARGWRQVSESDAEHARVSRSAAEIIGTLRTFPAAFTAPAQVRTEVARIVQHGRQAAAGAQVALLARDGLSLMLVLAPRDGEARLSCYLSGPAIPDVAARLPEPGRNPSGEPLAWNVVSSGPLATPHIFAEIMYVRLFFHPAQHLLTGGDSVVTHLTFRRAATPT